MTTGHDGPTVPGLFEDVSSPWANRLESYGKALINTYN
jgi:hypothetical protein